MGNVRFCSLTHDEDGRIWHEGKLFTGVGVDYWQNGQIGSELSYLDGIQDGWTRGWHENGVLRKETFYRTGKATGTRSEWHPNGQLKLEEEIEHGICLWSKEWNDQGEHLKEYQLAKGDPLFNAIESRRRAERSTIKPPDAK